MTYVEAMAGLQLVAEREVGLPRRQEAAEENAREDRSLAALRREQQEIIG